MLWFRSIPIFKLEIYDKKLGGFVRYCPHVYKCGFLKFFHELPANHELQEYLFGKIISTEPDETTGSKKIIEYCIENKLINAQWLKYFEWYSQNIKKIQRANSIFKRWISPFLYRSILPQDYKVLLKHGNSRATAEDEFGIDVSKNIGLNREDWMYASTSLASAFVHSRSRNPYIIVIYRKKYFMNIQSFLWARKDKSIDFRDTIVAIFRIRFTY